ncbi:MAG: hypothetical protein Q4E74_05690 [Ruminococcus sp.]|nr:hypothetical protein [Ruminococcus sp.]
MTDNKLRNIIRDEFSKIYADENVKAQILKGLTGDTMKTEKRESIITTANAENNEKTIAKETTTNGKARVAPRGRIAAAAAAVVLCLGGGAYLLKSGDLSDIENPSASSVAENDTENSVTDNVKSVEFDGYFDENGYTVYDKFGDISEIWRLSNGKFLVKQDASFRFNDRVSNYYYIIYNGETNSIEKVMESLLCNVYVYENGFSLEDMLIKSELGVNNTYAEFYDFDLTLVNKFSFKTKETGELIDATTCAPDGSALYVKTSGDGFVSFYKFTNDGDTEPVYTQNVIEKTSANDIDMLFASDDGSALYFIGPNWREDETDDMENVYKLCTITEGGYSKLYMPYEDIKVFERNNMLYVFSSLSAEYNVYQAESKPKTADMKDSDNPIGGEYCEYTFGDEIFGNTPSQINMSQSGKYIIAISWIADDDGLITDTLITVYESDGMKEIYTDAISGSIIPTDGQFVFDETTGDICAQWTNMGDDFKGRGVYTANVFGNEYSNFGIKQTVDDNSSVPQDGQTVTTTVTAVENSEVNETEDFKAVKDNYNPDFDADVSYITDEEQKEQILDWYDKFINAGYEPVELNHINDWSNGNPVTLYFTARNGDKVSMNIPVYDGANIEINDEYYSLPDVSILGLFDNYIGEFKITCTDYNYNYVGYVNYYGAKEDYLEWYNDFVNAGYEPVDISNAHAAGGGIYPKLSFKVNNSEVVICDSQYPDDANICVNGKYYLIPEEKLNVLDFSDKIRNYYSDLY